MDWMLWALILVALGSAVTVGQAVRARRRGPGWPAAGWVLGLGVLILGWAVVSFVYNRVQVTQALSVVAPDQRAFIEATARSELATRLALTVAASLPALVLGIGFLGAGRGSGVTAR